MTTYQKTVEMIRQSSYNVVRTGGEEMDVEVRIDPEYKLPKVIILTEKVTDEVNAIVSRLSEEAPQIIAGFRDNMLRIIEPDELNRVDCSVGDVFS